MLKTFAQKLSSSVRTITDKYREDDKFVVWYTDKKGERKPRVFYNEGLQAVLPTWELKM